MDNLGRAIYLAGFALLFIFAASASIYLYGTLNTYLGQAAKSTNIEYRAENKTEEDLSSFRRPITSSEIYLSLDNMVQMHIDTLKLNNTAVTQQQMLNRTQEYRNFLLELYREKDHYFSYVSSNGEVKYHTISSE